jgi:hypothetical protein
MCISGTHFIVDVNFFPSFGGFPGAGAALARAIQTVVENHAK